MTLNHAFAPRRSAVLGSLAAALVALGGGGPGALAATAKSVAPAFHLTKDRGAVRTVDLSAFKGTVSSEILAGPTNGLDSAYVVYTRMAAGAPPRGMFSMPVDHTYLVLSGALNVQLGTDRFVAEPETLVFVPAGVPVQVWNKGAEANAVFEVVTPAQSRDLASLMKPAKARKLENAAQYVHIPPKLEKLAGGQGHDSLNERVLVDRATGSNFVLERLNDVLKGGGRTENHIHPFDQVYFIRKGSMTVLYGLTTLEAKANQLVVLPAGVVHNNSNTAPEVQSSITLLLPEPEKGKPAGSAVTIQGRGGGGTPTAQGAARE